MNQTAEWAAEAADQHVLSPEQADALLAKAQWGRYAVLGDSLAEGILEESEGYRTACWADRVHQALLRVNPDLEYLNVGYRGLLAHQVRATQLQKALDFRPDFATVVCGGNDILAPVFDAEGVKKDIDAQVKALTEAGATVFLFGLMNITNAFPEFTQLRPRLEQLNEVTLDVARRYGAVWVDLWTHPASGDKKVYSSDLLHMSARGHAIIATRVVESLGLHLDGEETLPEAEADEPEVAAIADEEPEGHPDWAPESADFDKPSIARMYDYLLGGTRHSTKDRAVAEEAVAAAPGIKLTIWENRKLIKRITRYAAAQGITQILDIGSGIPARGAVHTLAHAINPAIKVVYVDIDPVAAARGAELLADTPNGASAQGDLSKPHEILALPEVTSQIDFGKPVALFFLNVLHFLDPAAVQAALAVYREKLAPGSLLAISHGTADEDDHSGGISKVYADAYGHTHMRTKEELAELFGDFTLIEPGVVQLPDWRPEPSPLSGSLDLKVGAVNCYAAVGIK